MLSVYGLGFQLLIMATMLSFDKVHLILPFFIWFSLFIFIFIGIRKIYIS